MTKPIDPRLEMLLRSTFPDCIVEWTVDPDEGTYLAEVYHGLRDLLSRIPDGDILSECSGVSRLLEEEDVSPEQGGLEQSYHRFFLGLRDESCKFVTDDPEENEDGEELRIERIGAIGCLVAVSELAPVAIIQFDSIEQSEEWGDHMPDVGEHLFSLDGKPLDIETHFLEWHGDEAVEQLHRLRDRIAEALDSLEIAAIPPETWNEPISWLKAGDDLAGVAPTGQPMTVRDAFFFWLP